MNLFFILFLLAIKTAGSAQKLKSRSGKRKHSYFLFTSY